MGPFDESDPDDDDTEDELTNDVNDNPGHPEVTGQPAPQ